MFHFPTSKSITYKVETVAATNSNEMTLFDECLTEKSPEPWPEYGCLNYMTPEKRSLGTKVVYSLASTAAFMESF